MAVELVVGTHAPIGPCRQVWTAAAAAASETNEGTQGYWHTPKHGAERTKEELNPDQINMQ